MLEDQILIYILAISLLGVFVTVYDKLASIKFKKNRVAEKKLILLAAIGASISMYITMILIRHKTRHKKFMLGLSVIILIQLILIYIVKII